MVAAVTAPAGVAGVIAAAVVAVAEVAVAAVAAVETAASTVSWKRNSDGAAARSSRDVADFSHDFIFFLKEGGLH